jgi:hypothetical protein
MNEADGTGTNALFGEKVAAMRELWLVAARGSASACLWAEWSRRPKAVHGRRTERSRTPFYSPSNHASRVKVPSLHSEGSHRRQSMARALRPPDALPYAAMEWP